ncbi:MAG: glycine zipper domain-containing protein [Planctomycetota bacterium]|jgi:outer membrane lipoprotein SlyB
MYRSLLVIVGFFIIIAVVFIAGCESDAKTGAVIGGLAGATIGQAAGGDTEATLIGAGVGAGAGYIIGNEQDKKKQKAETEELRDESNLVTVDITNSNGSVSQVKLRREGSRYIGPKGEYYEQLPSEEQLRPVYGF